MAHASTSTVAEPRKATKPKAKHPGGRHSKLDATRQARIVELLQAGCFIETACLAAGVSESTYHRWIVRGDPDGKAAADLRYRQFREAATRARADFEARAVITIQKAASDDWRANAWILERTFPDRYGKRIRQEHSGAGGGPIEVGSEALNELLGLMAPKP